MASAAGLKPIPKDPRTPKKENSRELAARPMPANATKSRKREYLATLRSKEDEWASSLVCFGSNGDVASEVSSSDDCAGGVEFADVAELVCSGIKIFGLNILMITKVPIRQVAQLYHQRRLTR